MLILKKHVVMVLLIPFLHQNYHLNLLSKLLVYFNATIVIGAKSLNAPNLNLSNDLPFEFVPYGKIIIG